ncbi:hypothetical protein SAMN04487788_2204 [Microbacterium testaceum StLB037]|uniref:Uncharacterized protein n=1 Tax=Microbacterium testaceum (strain StLB037) TaxID=979556 RepID=A0A1H0Q4R2_MICTS|nr:hypothetical protein SAMN04487788_2204 [Microbacterium testaceum StLB037]
MREGRPLPVHDRRPHRPRSIVRVARAIRGGGHPPRRIQRCRHGAVTGRPPRAITRGVVPVARRLATGRRRIGQPREVVILVTLSTRFRNSVVNLGQVGSLSPREALAIEPSRRVEIICVNRERSRISVNYSFTVPVLQYHFWIAPLRDGHPVQIFRGVAQESIYPPLRYSGVLYRKLNCWNKAGVKGVRVDEVLYRVRGELHSKHRVGSTLGYRESGLVIRCEFTPSRK